MVVTSITPTRMVVTVERLGPGIVVKPPCAEVFAVLQTTKHVYASYPGLGGRTVKVAEDLFKVEDDSAGSHGRSCPPGWRQGRLAPARAGRPRRELLERDRVAAAGDPCPHRTSWRSAAARAAVDRAMPELVRDHDRGLVRHQAGAARTPRG